MTGQERFNAAVMNWISEATSIYEPRSDGGRSIMSSACLECWAVYGKDSTNHDAAPAARAVSDEDAVATEHARSTAANKGGGTHEQRE